MYTSYSLCIITDTLGHVHFCIKQVETRFKNKNMLKITDKSEATKVLLKLTDQSEETLYLYTKTSSKIISFAS